MNMLTCTKCGEVKSAEDFYALPRVRTGRFSECKKCNCARARAFNRRRRQEDPTWSVNNRLRSVYGISLAEYEGMLAAQGGGCAVCGSTDAGGKGRFHVDHDHSCCPGSRSCGRCVRGLLCHGCNVGIGSLRDDPERLLAAAAYLLTRRDVLSQAVTF